jgi:hypothetical protein
MNAEQNATLTALAKGYDQMTVRIAALTAILGAICEKAAPDEKRIAAWARAIAEHSGDQSQTAVQRMALDILRGVDSQPPGSN